MEEFSNASCSTRRSGRRSVVVLLRLRFVLGVVGGGGGFGLRRESERLGGRDSRDGSRSGERLAMSGSGSGRRG